MCQLQMVYRVTWNQWQNSFASYAKQLHDFIKRLFICHRHIFLLMGNISFVFCSDPCLGKNSARQRREWFVQYDATFHEHEHSCNMAFSGGDIDSRDPSTHNLNYALMLLNIMSILFQYSIDNRLLSTYRLCSILYEQKATITTVWLTHYSAK